MSARDNLPVDIRNHGGNRQRNKQIRFNLDSIEGFLSDAIVATDIQGIVSFWNQAACQLYGWSSAEVLGKKFTSLLKTQALNGRDFELEISRSETWSGEVTQSHRDGRRMVVQATVTSAKDEDGQPAGNYWIVKPKLADLPEPFDRESPPSAMILDDQNDTGDAEYKWLFFHNPIAQMIIEEKCGFQEVNPAFCALVGYEFSEVQSRNPLEIGLISKQEYLRLRTLMKIEEDLFETQLKHRDGHQVSVQVSWRKIPERENDRYLFTVFDISEHTAVEKQLTQLERMYAVLSQVNQTIVHAGEPMQLYQSICEVSARFGEFVLTSVSLWDPATNDLRPVAAHGLSVDDWPLPIINIKEGPFKNSVTAIAYKSSSVMTSDDVNMDRRSRSFRKSLQTYEFHSLAVIPFKQQGKTIGVINLISREVGFFKSAEEIRLLEEIGMDVSFALDTIAMEKTRKQWADAFVHCAHGIGMGQPSTNTILTCNPTFARMQGRTVEELTSMPIWEMFAPEELKKVKGYVQEADQKGSSQFEANMIRKNGEVYPVQLDLVSVRDNHGKILYRVATHQDISQRRQADASIRYQAELLDNVMDAIVASDAEDCITFWNPAAEQLYGWKEKEVLGQNEKTLLQTMYGETDPERALEEESWDSKIIRVATQVNRNGERIPVEIARRKLIQTNGAEGWVSVIRDMSERDAAQAALLFSQHTLKLFVDYAPAAIAMFDRDMVYLAASHRYLTDYHLPDIDIIGRSHYDVFPEIPERWKEIHRNCLEGAVERAEEDPFPRGDGSLDWVKWEIRPWYESAGRVGGLLLFSEVITERKQTEINIRNRNQDLLLIKALNDAANRGEEIQQITDIFSEQATTIFGSQGVSIYMVNPDGKSLVLQSASVIDRFVDNLQNIFGSTDYHMVIPLREGSLFSKILHSDQGLISSDPKSIQSLINELFDSPYLSQAKRTQWNTVLPKIIETIGIGSIMSIPLVSSNGTIGILVLFSQYEFSAEDLRRIRSISHQMTAVLLRKYAEAQVQRQIERLIALHTIDKAISSSQNLHEALNIVVEQTISQLNVDASCLLLFDQENKRFTYAVGKGFKLNGSHQKELPLGKGLPYLVYQTRQKVHVSDLGQIRDQLVRKELVDEEGFVEYYGVSLAAREDFKGVLEVFHRSSLIPDPDWERYLETLAGQAAIAVDNIQLFDGLRQTNHELVTAYEATIAGWSHAMDLRDRETEGHSQRVTELTLRLAEAVGMGPEELVQIRRGALLHDIGKLGVPDQLLFKPGALTEDEWVIMRQHPGYAYSMLKPIEYLRDALDIPYSHHERWNGSGYPQGLKGEEIPLAARLFAVVDVWDALRSDRPYRPSWSSEETRQYIKDQAGIQFDPKVVEVFLSLIGELGILVEEG